MTPPPVDRNRASRLMQAAQLDALVLLQPEHVAQVTGVHPGPASLFRRAGAATALVPADDGLPVAAVFPDLAEGAVRMSGVGLDVAWHRTWVDTAQVRPHGADEPLAAILLPRDDTPRPATFVPDAAYDALARQLAARGLDRGRLGLDLGFVGAADLGALAAALPHAELVDATDVVRRLRMVKTPREIERLRLAAQLSLAGYDAALAAIGKGVDRTTLSRAYTAGVAAAGDGIGGLSSWDYISIGPDPWGAGRPAEDGDIVKLDLGVVIGGYSSDFARTVCVGQPSRAARELHAALLAGLEAGLAMLRPGAVLGDLHERIIGTVRGHGVVPYVRGHFGHGLGNDPFSEQWPFIAAGSDVVAEAGMVLAVEAPHYVDGLGGFIVEDQVLVTEDGHALMTDRPRGLLTL